MIVLNCMVRVCLFPPKSPLWQHQHYVIAFMLQNTWDGHKLVQYFTMGSFVKLLKIFYIYRSNWLFISFPKSPTELQCWMSTNQAVPSSSTISAVHRFVNFKSNQKGQENVCVYIYIILFYFFMTSTLNKEEDSLEPPLGLNHRCMTSAARRPEPCINY